MRTKRPLGPSELHFQGHLEIVRMTFATSPGVPWEGFAHAVLRSLMCSPLPGGVRVEQVNGSMNPSVRMVQERERQCVGEWKEGRLHGGHSRDQWDTMSVVPGDRGVTMLDLDPRRDREIQSVWMTRSCRWNTG